MTFMEELAKRIIVSSTLPPNGVTSSGAFNVALSPRAKSCYLATVNQAAKRQSGLARDDCPIE